MDPLDAVRELITGVLAEISAEARLIELTDSPDGQWYTISIDIPGTVSKPLVLPKPFARSARAHPDCRRTLRNVLQVEVRMQRARLVIDQSRESLAGVGRVSVCPRCSMSIALGESVRGDHGDVFHLKCGE